MLDATLQPYQIQIPTLIITNFPHSLNGIESSIFTELHALALGWDSMQS